MVWSTDHILSLQVPFFSVIELSWILTCQLFLKLTGLQLHLYFEYNEIWHKITLAFDAYDQRISLLFQWSDPLRMQRVNMYVYACIYTPMC